jgi:hypothetical protein
MRRLRDFWDDALTLAATAADSVMDWIRKQVWRPPPPTAGV